jgi:hypothetical protein
MHRLDARSVLSFSGFNCEYAMAQVELDSEALKEITLAVQAKAHAVHTLRKASVGLKDDAVSEIDYDRSPVGCVGISPQSNRRALRHCKNVKSERPGKIERKNASISP